VGERRCGVTVGDGMDFFGFGIMRGWGCDRLGGDASELGRRGTRVGRRRVLYWRYREEITDGE